MIQEAAGQHVVRHLSIRLALKIGPMLEGQAALRVDVEEGTAEELTKISGSLLRCLQRWISRLSCCRSLGGLFAGVRRARSLPHTHTHRLGGLFAGVRRSRARALSLSQID